ncbi:MAG: TonB-dependent receptor [Gammaproteobacteria bacterium]
MSGFFPSQPVLRHLLRLIVAPFFLAGLALLSVPPAVAAEAYAGRPVVEVLREWQDRGLTLIYNDTLVPPELRVQQEPAAATGAALLGEILAPHGLKLRPVGPGVWSVVAGQADPAKDKAARPSQLDTIVVTTSRYALARNEAGVSTLLMQDELRALPKLADESLRAVHRLPGAASNGISGLAHIRGGEENETEIVLDGMPLSEPFHLKNFFSPVSVLDAEIVGAMDVYAGGFPVHYGDRMSAVVDVRSVVPPADGMRAIGASLYHTSGLAGGRFDEGRGRWLLSGRRSNLADAIKLVNSNLGEPKYLDSFSKVEYDFSDDTSGALHLLVVNDHVRVNNSQETEFAKVGDRSAYVWATAEHRWSERLSGWALLSYTNVDNDRDGTVDDPGERLGDVHDHRSHTATNLKLELQQGDDQLLFRYGLDLGLLDAHYAYSSSLEVYAGTPWPDSPPSLTVRQSALQPDGSQMGAFVSGRWRMTDRLTGELGMRWDNQTWDHVDGGTQLSPRLGLRYDPTPRTELRASWGRFFQAQAINELQLEDGIENFFPAQRADHLILSAEHELANRMRVRLEAYYKDYDELRPRFENQFDPLVLIPELQTDRIEVPATSGSARGVELLLNRRGAGPWGWWLSYTWSEVEDHIDGADVERSWDQTHSFNAGLNWINGPWDITLAGTWHTGWPTTPVSLGAAPPGEVPPVVVGARNTTRFDAFKSVDLRVAHTFALEKSELLAFVEFTNLLAQKNACCVEYTERDTGGGVYTLDRDVDDWIRFAPNFGVLWRF